MADPPVELHLPEWSGLLVQQLDFMRQATHFCDVVIRASDGSTLSAHRNILAASSPVFSDLLQKNTLLLEVANIDAATWAWVLNFIYLGKVTVPESQMPALKAAALSLGLKNLLPLLKQRSKKVKGDTHSNTTAPKTNGCACVQRADMLSEGEVMFASTASSFQDTTPSETSSIGQPLMEIDDLELETAEHHSRVTRGSPRVEQEVLNGKTDKDRRVSRRLKLDNDQIEITDANDAENTKPEAGRKTLRGRGRSVENKDVRREGSNTSVRKSLPIRRCYVNLGSSRYSDRVKSCFVNLSPDGEKNNFFMYGTDIARNGYVKLASASSHKKTDTSRRSSRSAIPSELVVAVIGEVGTSNDDPECEDEQQQQTSGFMCVPCKKEFHVKAALCSHFDKRHRYNCCGQCGQSFKTKSALTNHWKMRPWHKAKKENRYRLLAAGDKLQIVHATTLNTQLNMCDSQCANCHKGKPCACDDDSDNNDDAASDIASKASTTDSKSTPSRRTLSAPVTLANQMWTCKKCAVGFLTARRLEEHKVTVHGNNMRYACDVCFCTFSVHSSLGRHMRKKHNGAAARAVQTSSAADGNSTATATATAKLKSIPRRAVRQHRGASKTVNKSMMKEALKKSQRARAAAKETAAASAVSGRRQKKGREEAQVEALNTSRSRKSAVKPDVSKTSERVRKHTRETSALSTGRSSRKRTWLSEEPISIDLTEETEPDKLCKLDSSFDQEKADILREISEKINGTTTSTTDGNNATSVEIKTDKQKPMLFDEEDEEGDVSDIVGKLIQSFTSPLPQTPEAVLSSAPELVKVSQHLSQQQAKKSLNSILSEGAETEASSDLSMVIPVSIAVSCTTGVRVVFDSSEGEESSAPNPTTDSEAETLVPGKTPVNQSVSDVSLLSQSLEDSSTAEKEESKDEESKEEESKGEGSKVKRKKGKESKMESNDDSHNEAPDVEKVGADMCAAAAAAALVFMGSKTREAVVQNSVDGSIVYVVPEFE